MPSFGLEELMAETKNFYNKKIIEEAFQDINGLDKIYGKRFSYYLDSNDSYDMAKNEYDITKLFKIILNYVRLENENNIIIDDAEINLIKNFLNKQYSKFT